MAESKFVDAHAAFESCQTENKTLSTRFTQEMQPLLEECKVEAAKG